MKLSPAEVDHIAKLARLKLTDSEREIYCEQLSAILDYVEKMRSVDTKSVEATSQVTGLINIFQPDEIEASNISEELLAQAPTRSDGHLKIPKIFENK